MERPIHIRESIVNNAEKIELIDDADGTMVNFEQHPELYLT